MANDRLFQFRYSYERDLVDIYAKIDIGDAASPDAEDLGAARNFSIIGSSTVTNTGSSVINGDLGLSPGTSVTGFPPGIVNGVQHITDQAAADALSDANDAYIALQARTPSTNLSGQDLGSVGALAPGNYSFSTSAGLTGTLTLDAGGDPDAVWVFQIGTTLTTAAASSVNIINGGSARNVYFAVGSSATLGTTSAMKGNIIAAVSVTLTTGASILGRAIALSGAVTLDTNVVTLDADVDPILVNSKGISSIERNSAGNYTVTLKSNFYLFMDADCMFLSGDSAPNAPMMNIVSEDVNGDSKEVVIQLRNINGNAADPSQGELMMLHLVLRNAST